jgi:hypothetical protein
LNAALFCAAITGNKKMETARRDKKAWLRHYAKSTATEKHGKQTTGKTPPMPNVLLVMVRAWLASPHASHALP